MKIYREGMEFGKTAVSRAALAAVLGCVLTAGFTISPAHAQIDWWPMFHHDAWHTGFSTSIGPEDDDLIWTFQTDDWSYGSSPVVADGKVYLGPGDGFVYCVDIVTGEEVWRYGDLGKYGTNTAAVVDSNLYTGSLAGRVVCLDAEGNGDGTTNVTWTFLIDDAGIGDWVRHAPTVANGKVYVGSVENYFDEEETYGMVYCLPQNDPSGDGTIDSTEVIWSFRTDDIVVSSPAVGNGKVYIGSNDHNVYCLDAEGNGDGTTDLIWVFTTGYNVTSPPSVAGDRVYVGSGDYHLYCLPQDDPNPDGIIDSTEVIWSFQIGYDVRGSPAVAYGMVYVGSGNDRVYCLPENDPNPDGVIDPTEVIWTYTTGGNVYSSPAVADGKVYVGSWDNNVYCFDAFGNGDGTTDVIWSHPVSYFGESSPAIAAGAVYVAASDMLYAFGDPHCQVSPTVLDFGPVTLGSWVDEEFTIVNTGGDTLRGDVAEACDHYSIVQGEGGYELAPEESLLVIVHFEPSSIGVHNCTVETGTPLCCDVSCTGVAGQTHIVSCSPPGNEINVPVDTNISATFSIAMDEATINDTTFVVNAKATGLHGGTITYNIPTRTATLNPTEDFDDGEVVTVVLTTEIKSFVGVPLDSSYVWSFTAIAAAGHGIFEDDSVYAVGGEPYSVVAADLDGDGYIDLATVEEATESVSVLLNNGDGSFLLDQSYPAGASPRSVFAGDLDRDGNLDLVTANDGSSDVSVLLNNGDGTFTPDSVYSVGPEPQSVCAADLNGDGHLDLATADYAADQVSILLNIGDGTFASDSVYSVGGGPVSVCAADLDGDGDLDLAAADFDSNRVSVLLNNRDGTFGFCTDYAAGDHPYSVLTADLDGDSDLELAASNTLSNDVYVLLGNGDGTFAFGSVCPVGDYPVSMTAGDFDGDGDADLATANAVSTDISILLNDGDATFAPHSVYPAGLWTASVTTADFDGDTDLDLAVANYVAGSISILVNERTLAVEEAREMLAWVFSLAQNCPNPFNPTTEIRYELPSDCRVRLEIFNTLGQKVATLVDGPQRAGRKTVRWDAWDDEGARVSSGVYFCRLEAGGHVGVKKMVLME